MLGEVVDCRKCKFFRKKGNDDLRINIAGFCKETASVLSNQSTKSGPCSYYKEAPKFIQKWSGKLEVSYIE